MQTSASTASAVSVGRKPRDDSRDQTLAQDLVDRGVCEHLLRDALDDGGTDNVTVLIGRTLRKDAH